MTTFQNGNLRRTGRRSQQACPALAGTKQCTPRQGHPVIGFMADFYLDDLETAGFKHFNPMCTFPTASVYQNWDPMTFRMAPWHLVDSTEHSKDALVSQSPIVVFKSCNMLQALGIVYSRIVLPNSDVRGETKGKTYCPTTWNYAYQCKYASEYAHLLRQAGASSLLCQECILSDIAQWSNKSSSHPDCAFADSASTVMSGMMVSLTPVFKATVPRQVALSEYAEFKDPDDIVQQLNDILSRPDSFQGSLRQGQIARFSISKRRTGMINMMCPEQECESLVYHADQSRSMIKFLVCIKILSGKLESKPSMDGTPSPAPRLTGMRGHGEAKTVKSGLPPRVLPSELRATSVPANPADRQNPNEEGLRWKDLGEINLYESYLRPGKDLIQHVQLARSSTCPSMTSSSTCS